MQREHTFQHTLLDVGLLPLLPLINALWQMLRPSRLDSQDPTPPGDFSLSAASSGPSVSPLSSSNPLTPGSGSPPETSSFTVVPELLHQLVSALLVLS